MNHLRRFCLTFVLTIALTLSAFAGDIHCGIVSDPSSGSSATSVTGDMATGAATTNETSAETTYVDPVTEIALSLLQGVLALF
jgi:hypothetical protein